MDTMLQQTEVITITKKAEPTDTESPSCELMIHGQATGQRLQGCCLEAAFQCDAGYLIFLTDECPFEETLSIYVVDRAGVLQDSAHIFGIYMTGFFEKIQVQQPDQVLFTFFSGAIWAVRLFPCLRFRLPFWGEPLRVTRPFGFKRHFLIRNVGRISA